MCAYRRICPAYFYVCIAALYPLRHEPVPIPSIIDDGGWGSNSIASLMIEYCDIPQRDAATLSAAEFFKDFYSVVGSLFWSAVYCMFDRVQQFAMLCTAYTLCFLRTLTCVCVRAQRPGLRARVTPASSQASPWSGEALTSLAAAPALFAHAPGPCHMEKTCGISGNALAVVEALCRYFACDMTLIDRGSALSMACLL